MAKINFDISKRLDITVRRGDSFKLELTLKDSSDNALNLYGDKFHFLVRSASGYPMGTSGFIMSPAIIIPVEQTLTVEVPAGAVTTYPAIKLAAGTCVSKACTKLSTFENKSNGPACPSTVNVISIKAIIILLWLLLLLVVVI